METKKCHKCMTEIDKKATICPNCKTDLRNWFVRYWIITTLLVLFIIWSIGSNQPWDTSLNINNNSTWNQVVNDINWIWTKGYYTDDFWDTTDKSFITTKSLITWTFSNTATENSKLNVSLLINNSNEIYIKLFEYGSSNPVKSVSLDTYDVLVKDKDWNKYDLVAENRSDRLNIKNAKVLNDILIKWWKIQFLIKDRDFPSTYNFEIENSDGYSNIIQ